MKKNKFLAYGPDRHAVETVMRLHSVKRWHMIDTTRQQTLAEHSANVALLALVVSRTAPINYFDTFAAVAAYALVHDVAESFTGDIPTHTKREISGVADLEEMVTHVAFDIRVNANTRRLVKLCDLADGIRFIRLHGVDLTAEHAKEGLEEQLLEKFTDAERDLEWPEHLVAHVKNHLFFYAYERN
jgi:hypothetical protein